MLLSLLIENAEEKGENGTGVEAALLLLVSEGGAGADVCPCPCRWWWWWWYIRVGGKIQREAGSSLVASEQGKGQGRRATREAADVHKQQHPRTL